MVASTPMLQDSIPVHHDDAMRHHQPPPTVECGAHAPADGVVKKEKPPLPDGSLVATDTTTAGTAMPLESAPPAASASSSSAASKKKTKKKAPAKKKKKAAPKHACIGMYIDAMDTNNRWAEARIIDCDPPTDRIEVKFIGWGDRWNMWTDVMSVKPHGEIFPLKKGRNPKSWDGARGIFSDAPDSDVAVTQNSATLSSYTNNSVRVEESKPLPLPLSLPLPLGKVKQTAKQSPPPVKTDRPNKLPPAARTRPSSKTSSPRAAPKRKSSPSQDAGLHHDAKRGRFKKQRLPPQVSPSNKAIEAQLNARRLANEQEMAQNEAFLQTCAEIWKRQVTMCAAQEDHLPLVADGAAAN